jgi:hypothetical protein
MENLQKIIKELTNRITLLEQKVNFLTNEKGLDKPKTKSIKRDKTKYMFEGKVFAKNQLVLAVVKAYLKNYPNTSYKDLTNAFSKSLQGSLGVVALYDEVKHKPDAKKRYYINDILNLTDTKAVVCTQWGAFNINKFILRAKELGFEIKEV